MRRPHVHSDMELTIVVQGSMDFVLGDAHVEVPAGHFVIHWAARPHYTAGCSKPFLKYTLHIPLPLFMQFRLPSPFVRRLLDGEVVCDQGVSRVAEDRAAVERWHSAMNPGNAVSQRLMLLEIEARLGWMAEASAAGECGAVLRTVSRPLPLLQKVEAMIRFVAWHYLEPISSSDVARAVGLHPKYAMTVFRQNIGSSILDFITAQRVVHAQRLLSNTELKTVDVGFQSGFGTLSRFYNAFKTAHGISPNAYRKMKARW